MSDEMDVTTPDRDAMSMARRALRLSGCLTWMLAVGFVVLAIATCRSEVGMAVINGKLEQIRAEPR